MFPMKKRPLSRLFLPVLLAVLAALPSGAAEVHLAQGAMAGEPGAGSILLQSRLTATSGIDKNRAVPGAAGVARFLVDLGEDGRGTIVSPWLRALPENDFIVRHPVLGLQPDTRYRYRIEFGGSQHRTQISIACWFRTLPGADSPARLAFLMFNCMGWGQFMDGYSNRKGYDGPDKHLGYAALVHMQKFPDSHFFIGAGDLVYYDTPAKDTARTLPAMRVKWQQQFSLPRLVSFVGLTGGYWMKDDHDFRYNDADLTGPREPSPELGIRTFREQMPVVPQGDSNRPTYRTVRATRHAQFWFLEGRDYRSPNQLPDGPAKSIWGPVQKAWLQRTLVESDATWRFIITPTPMVGPDGAGKRDNHTNPQGFRHEGDQFFEWIRERGLKNVVLFTGDRHWQYHSIHPTGVPEFACGSLSRENAVGDPPAPGAPGSSDPNGLVKQPYVTSKQDGGFLRVLVEADGSLRVEIIDQAGSTNYVYESKTP
jgi:alkaline phosphatase/alkaline phosphatase D